MCGLNGIIIRDKVPNRDDIISMNNALYHRGPDANGILKFENCFLGHTRLSIQDISKNGNQPMSVDGRFWIIYNGEVYNFNEIREDLKQIGYIFYSKTDTEVILNAFKEWGVDCFSKFNGMWCFAILDKQTRKLIICRDRYGVKPCYYYVNSNKFIFSSEIKGIFASNNEINLDGNKCFKSPKELEGYFTTIYKDLHIIPPGSYFEINLNNLEYIEKRWWVGLNHVPYISPNYNKAKEVLREKLYNATKIRLISDAQVATSLSGGVDSSIIFSILNNISKDKNISLNPFVVKEGNDTFNNAEELAKFYNRNVNIVRSAHNEFEDYCTMFSKIEIPSTYFNQIHLYKEQKLNAFKVSIDGHGADECLGGYIKDIRCFSFENENNINDLYKTIINVSGENELTNIKNNFSLIKDVSYFSQETLNQLFTNKLSIENDFISKDYLTNLNKPLISKNFIYDLEELSNFPFSYQYLYFQANFGHLQWLLNKWDRASMASSIEVRAPFMDWNVFQYSLSLPMSYKIKGGYNKSILRETFSDIVPSNIHKDKRKQGLGRVDIDFDKNFISEICNQTSFLESEIWDGKKIKKSIVNENYFLLSSNVNQLRSIIKIYLLNEGLNKIKKQKLENIRETNINSENLLTKDELNISA
tara:strand:- start:146 stop:2077 length:1932 start_codon:yes stop_codon:yes gene_type:complete